MSCWFCQVREAEDLHAFKVEMYGDVDTRQSASQTQVAYNVRHLSVPRCGDCAGRHRIAGLSAVMSLLFAVLLLAAVLSAVFQWVSPWIWGLVAGSSFAFTLSWLGIRSVAHRNILTIRNAKADYPEIRTLLDNGYRFGRRPKGTPPVSSRTEEEPDASAGPPVSNA